MQNVIELYTYRHISHNFTMLNIFNDGIPTGCIIRGWNYIFWWIMMSHGESWSVIMSHDESLWVIMSHYESWWVLMSHTCVYTLADHMISTLTGFTTWFKSQPRFEMMEFHKKWIQNGKCYQNIYVSTYISYDFTMINIFQWWITKWLYFQPRLKS